MVSPNPSTHDSMEKKRKANWGKKSPPLEAPLQTHKKMVETRPHSAKKNARRWNTHDEIELLKGFEAYQATNALPQSNKSPVYDYIRKLKFLEQEYTNVQMKDKLKRFKDKFDGLKENHRFKSPHEDILYQLWRKIWGSGEEEKEDGKNGDEGLEEEKKKRKEKVVEMVEEEEKGLACDGETKQLKSKESGKPASVNVSSRAAKLIDVLRRESLVMKNEIHDELAREEEETLMMVREALGSSGDCVEFASEENRKWISSTRELPALEKAEADILHQKRQKQTPLDLDVSSKRMQLLQEECQLLTEKLRSKVEDQNPNL